jgi:hypothetical protein
MAGVGCERLKKVLNVFLYVFLGLEDLLQVVLALFSLVVLFGKLVLQKTVLFIDLHQLQRFANDANQ